MAFLKVLIILLILLVMAVPFIPIHLPFCLCFYNHPVKKRPKNLINLGVTILLVAAIIILMPYVLNFANWFCSLKYVSLVISWFPSYALYGATLFQAIFANIAFCAAALILLALVFGADHIGQIAADKWRAWRQARKEQKNRKGQSDGRSDVGTTSDQELPAHLLPEPEPEIGSSTIIVEANATPSTKHKNNRAKPSGSVQTPSNTHSGTRLTALLQRALNIFYTKIDTDWYANAQSRNAAVHLKYFLVFVGILYLLLFGMMMIPVFFPFQNQDSWFYSAMHAVAKNCYMVPSAALVLLTELFWFLRGEGLPSEETFHAASQHKRTHGYTVDLEALDEDLMRVYAGSYAVKRFNSADIEGESLRKGLNLTEDAAVKSVAEFVQAQGLTLCPEYLQGVRSIQNGDHVLFHAPLYTAAGMYIYPILNMHIVRGERVVVICQNNSEVPNVVKHLQQGFMRVTRTHQSLWKVVSRRDLGTDNCGDVLVLTPRDFRDEKLYIEAADFLKQVTVALLPDIDRVVSANNYLCQVIAQRLAQAAGKAVQYIFMSTRNILNLDNAIVEFFLLRGKPKAVQGDYAYGNVQIYIWKRRGGDTVILDNAAQTLLPEAGISTIAAEHRIPNINVLSDGALYSNQVNPHWLDIYDSAERPVGFTVVADDHYNLPSVIHAYSRYMGKAASVLHIISKPYMLLDYFYDRAERYLYERPLIEQSITEHAEQDKTRMLMLLCQLMEGIPLTLFLQRMDQLEGVSRERTGTASFAEINSMVELCLERALGCNVPENQEHFTLYENETQDFKPVIYIRIREDYDVFRPLMADTELVRVRFTGDREDAYLNLFKKMLGQRYLAGQNLVYAHKNYVIDRIDWDNGILYVDDASSVHGLSQSYIQCRRYTVPPENTFAAACEAASQGKDVTESAIIGDRFSLAGPNHDMRWISMVRSADAHPIQGDTVAYYMLQSNAETIDVTTATIPVKALSESVRKQLRRSLGHYMYVCMETGLPQSDRLTMTVAVMLQEVTKTLFPDSYFCLSVCPILRDPDRIYQTDDPMLRLIAGMYPRLEGWKQPKDGCVEFLIIEDCVGGNGIMDLLYEKEAAYLQNVFWMLSDYLQWESGREERGYLYFGMDRMPDIFDFDSAQKVFSSFAKSHLREREALSNIASAQKCSLCGAKTENPFLWNGKTVCPHCDNEHAPSLEEAKQIADYIAGYYKKTYQATIPAADIRMVPPNELRDGSLSALDVGACCIIVADQLPLTALHQELARQLVRLWQYDNLNNTGCAEFEGQVEFALHQYLHHLLQHQRRGRLYRRMLSGTDSASEGFCTILQALQNNRQSNCFAYMYKQFGKDGSSAVIQFTAGHSTRATGGESVRHYFYEQLSTQLQAVYTTLYDALMSMAKSVDLPGCDDWEGQAELVLHSILQDHPEIFWVNSQPVKSYLMHDGSITANLVYTMDETTRQHRQRDLDRNAAEFMSEITPELSEYEVALAAYEAVVKRLDYDTLGLERQTRSGGVTQTIPDDLRTSYGALVSRKAVCAGYAKAYQYLLQKAGVECLYVRGYCTDREYHAWNIVRMEGNYYHVDVTWGDHSDTDSSKTRSGIDYAYFGLNDSEIQRSRNIDQKPAAPQCNADSCNYFVRNGLLFSRYDHKQICEIMAQRLKDPAVTEVDIRFTNSRIMSAAEKQLVHNGGFFEILRMADRSSSQYAWHKKDALCILHFAIKES